MTDNQVNVIRNHVRWLRSLADDMQLEGYFNCARQTLDKAFYLEQMAKTAPPETTP